MAKGRGAGPSGRFIHYQPERTDYAVSDDELEKLRKGESPISKDFFLVTVSVAIPTLMNAIVESASQPEFKLTMAMFLNYVVGILCFLAAAQNAIRWYRERRDVLTVVDQIKQKPRFEVPLAMLTVGPVRMQDSGLPPEAPAGPS